MAKMGGSSGQSKWFNRSTFIFIIWGFPQGLQRIWALYTSEPFIPWLQERDIKIPNIAPYWIKGVRQPGEPAVKKF